MQAYIDDSMNSGEVLVFGGLIASTERWEAFYVAWQQCLNDAPWDNFKMSHVWHRCRGKKLEHAKRHYRTMCEHVQGGLCFVVPIGPPEQSADRHGLKGTPCADPYYWAPKGVINGLAQNQREWGLSKPVDFIFDERPDEEEKDAILNGWNIYLATVPPEVGSVSGKPPVFADDKQVLPLQAADMWSWWCRRTWLTNNGTIPKDSYPIPWGQYGNIPQLIVQWTPEDIDQDISRVAEGLRNPHALFERYPGLRKNLENGI